MIFPWRILTPEEVQRPRGTPDYIFMVFNVILLFCLVCGGFVVFLRYRRLVSMRRRVDTRRHYERVSQRRRPGAAYRDHQIFRKIMKTVREFIGQIDGVKVDDSSSHESTDNTTTIRNETDPDTSTNGNDVNDNDIDTNSGTNAASIPRRGDRCFIRHTRSGAVYGHYAEINN